MAVLQFVPDLPRSSEPGVDHSLVSPVESSVILDNGTRIFSAVITPPRVPPSVLTPFLQFAAELALRSTGATGCAVAMRAGAGFRCYSSVGDAPPVNSPVRLAGTLTGMCVRKGKTIRHNDLAEEETGEPGGYTGDVRSLLLAPIFQDGNVGGVIGLFAPEPHAFLDEHVTALEHLAGVIGIGLLHPDRLQASTQVAENSSHTLVRESASTYDPVPRHDADRATHALENLANVISSVLMNAPRPALPSEETSVAPNGQPRKRLYGLPCAKCGAYFTSDQPSCSVCGAVRPGKR